ncbi:TetR/AcrR family transcriptional regulator [Streptomyces sp. NPDC050619]|uniref:TetR/AcrR family transcriptional regulator n=1 Tax=Streptomyces sp. NPDC050619 TaxID=3157214 RepID=UPI003415D128
MNRTTSDQPSFLLDAAAEVFLAVGFDRTSMNEIATRAGVSKTTVYAYFRDKLELFHAVVRRSASKVSLGFDQALLGSANDTEEKLSRVALFLLESMTEPGRLAFLRMLITERDRIPEPLWMVNDFGVHPVINAVSAILGEDAAQHGYSVPELNAHATLFIRTAVAGLQLPALLDPDFSHDSTFLKTHADWITAVFLRGIRPRGGA